ncbi:hypothetical protein AWC15_13120 [Mycobacterium lacus]|uniref:Uncharacterized protein n=1 Tax=Mycobacterium lacus TaxID=169765 RepID=A0A1X1YTK6_9MYCO|nr:hypothetical protein AWC15_13120 [Mycobacterium lacus]BBX95841.1 hypothetical protein MLAC_11350 [Mycobacterium lacus]
MYLTSDYTPSANHPAASPPTHGQNVQSVHEYAFKVHSRRDPEMLHRAKTIRPTSDHHRTTMICHGSRNGKISAMLTTIDAAGRLVSLLTRDVRAVKRYEQLRVEFEIVT